MKNVTADAKLAAYCGLSCGACGQDHARLSRTIGFVLRSDRQ